MVAAPRRFDERTTPWPTSKGAATRASHAEPGGRRCVYDFRALLVPPKEFRDVHTRVPAAQAAVCLPGSARADALQPACCRCLRPGSWSEPAHRSQSPAHRCRLRAGGAVPRARGDAARHRRRRRPELAAGRAVLVSQPGGGRLRVHPGDAGARTRKAAFDHAKLAATLSAAAEGHVHRSHACPFQSIEPSADGANVSFDANAAALDVRRARERSAPTSGLPHREPKERRAAAARGVAEAVAAVRWERRSRRPTASGPPSSATGTSGCATSPRAGAAADHGRREVLRLRHGQRRLEQQRPRHRALVARLEEDRHLPAGRARGRRDVSRQHAGRPRDAPDAARLEVPAARRQGHGHAAPRRHRRRSRHGWCASQMPPDYHRATLGDDVSLRDWQWKPDGSRSRSSRRRATTRRPRCAWPTRRRARSARS